MLMQVDILCIIMYYFMYYRVDKKSYSVIFCVLTGPDNGILLMGANRKWLLRFRMATEFVTF